jgi:hypothetical protein
VTTTPFQTIGTDPLFIQAHGARTVKSPMLTAYFDGVITKQVAIAMGQPASSEAVRAVAEQKLATLTAAGLRKEDGAVSALAMLGAVTAGVDLSSAPERTLEGAGRRRETSTSGPPRRWTSSRPPNPSSTRSTNESAMKTRATAERIRTRASRVRGPIGPTRV